MYSISNFVCLLHLFPTASISPLLNLFTSGKNDLMKKYLISLHSFKKPFQKIKV